MCVVTKIQLNERIKYFYGLFGNMFLRKHMINFLTLINRSAELTLKHKLMKLKRETFEKQLQETTDDDRLLCGGLFLNQSPRKEIWM